MYLNARCIVILMVVAVDVMAKAFYNITLSSARIRQGTMPKPTKITKRRNIERDIIYKTAPEIQSPPADGRRISPDEIWNWDYWCKLQPKTGKCLDFETRHYYDTQIDQCVNFTYTGCDGNKNNFESSEKCEQHCHGATYLSLKDETPNFCALQPDAGICLALARMYYYDINKGDCLTFHYGGCGGNRNRFSNKKNCLSDCKGT